jgi:hypothetical protein
VPLLGRQHALENETPQSVKLLLRKQPLREREEHLLRKVLDVVALRRKKAERDEKQLKDEDR